MRNARGYCLVPVLSSLPTLKCPCNPRCSPLRRHCSVCNQTFRQVRRLTVHGCRHVAERFALARVFPVGAKQVLGQWQARSDLTANAGLLCVSVRSKLVSYNVQRLFNWPSQCAGVAVPQLTGPKLAKRFRRGRSPSVEVRWSKFFCWTYSSDFARNPRRTKDLTLTSPLEQIPGSTTPVPAAS